MNKVVTINLNGRAYQLEEAAYGHLRKYMANAANQLTDDPDRDEIMADFEQAIADKCDQFVNTSKTVVTAREIAGIIDEMGPIGDEESAHSSSRTDGARRLYQIHDGAILAGVCVGLAAYTNIDVTVIRLVMIVATFVTGGLVILVYLALALLLPVARTPEQKAAARGYTFRADDILDRARAKYADLADGSHWQKLAEDSKPALNNLGEIILRVLRFMAAVVALAGTIAIVGLVAGWVASIWSLALSGRVAGYTLDPAMSTWLVGTFVTSAIAIVLLPVLGLTLATWRYARGVTGRGNIWWTVTGLAAWAVAIGITIAIPLGSTQLRTALYNQQGHINLGARTVCVGDDVYCGRMGAAPKCVRTYIDMGSPRRDAVLYCAIPPTAPLPPVAPAPPSPGV